MSHIIYCPNEAIRLAAVYGGIGWDMHAGEYWAGMDYVHPGTIFCLLDKGLIRLRDKNMLCYNFATYELVQ